MNTKSFFPKKDAVAKSPMKPSSFFEGSDKTPVGLNIEVYRPNDPPHIMENPLVPAVQRSVFMIYMLDRNSIE
jgi:hypothetical protein